MKTLCLLTLTTTIGILLTACEPQQAPIQPKATPDAARVSATRDMISLYANIAYKFYSYGTGKTPSLAIGRWGNTIEVHQSQNTSYQYYQTTNTWLGNWSEGKKIPKGPIGVPGRNPAVAAQADQIVVCATDPALDGTLIYSYGRLTDSGVTFKATGVDLTTDGIHRTVGEHPSLVITNSGLVIVVYESKGNLYYTTGQLKPDADQVKDPIRWTTGELRQYGSGYNPSLAINSQGQLIETHEQVVGGDRQLVQRVGTYTTTDMTLGSTFYRVASGVRPSIALDEEGNWITVYTYSNYIYQLVGKLENGTSKLYTGRGVCAGQHASLSLVYEAGHGTIGVSVDDGYTKLLACFANF